MDADVRAVADALRARGMAPELLAAALDRLGGGERSLYAVLVEDQLITESEYAGAVADAYGLDAVELSAVTVDPAAMVTVPLPLARRHRMLPIARTDRTLTVAVDDPGNVLALDDIRAATGLVVSPVVVGRDELTRLLDRYTRESTDLDQAAAELAASDSALSDDFVVDEDAPVVRFVNSLIERAVSSRASDIHLEPTQRDLRVRLRIDGVLHEVDSVPRPVQPALISRLKIMSGLDITERRVPQNGRITIESGSRPVDLRTATLPTVWGEKVVLRVLDTGGIDLDLRKLGFSDHDYGRFATSFRKPHGMVLVTGPTGSGKSTTLYATLTEIARPEINVITVEDPVEYRLDGINQVQVNAKAGLTFAAVLPAILRSDPDAVLIGEIRDRTTAQLAVEAAMTGHLVLSTLHTNDAPSAMTRLTEMGIEAFLVGSSVDAVLAQRLARRLCDWCKEPYDPEPSDLRAIEWPAELVAQPDSLYRAVGCRSCAGTGYRGRLALTEVMLVGERIERLTVERAPASELAKVAMAEGMTTLREDGVLKVAAGLTTVDEVLRVSV
jgi:type IV pilus assembly protein PilB